MNQNNGNATQGVEGLSDAKRERDQIVKNGHAAALSALAGGIAHRLNNVLSGVLGGAFMIRQKLPSGSEFEKSLSLIENAGEEATSLTEQLLAFARRDLTEYATINVGTLVDDCCFFLKHVIDRRVQLETDIACPTTKLRANPALLLQALTNLGINSGEAISGEGTLRIDARLEPGEGSNPKDHVVITITDTGDGIAAGDQVHLFKPYFTTKDPQAHAGLGLVATGLIIGELDGSVALKSSGASGTAFEVRLPVTPAGAGKAIPSNPPTAPQGRGCILVVDDEHSLLRLMTVYLTSLGYEVLSAINGKAAVDLFRIHTDKILLAVVDVSMPVMDGPKCVEELKKIQSDIKVIFTTGHQIESILGEKERAGAVGSIKKPFKPAELGSLVHEVLKD